MVVRRFPPVLVASVILALRVLAYASPPDPDWIAGFWDNGDYDDAVIMVTATSAAADNRPRLDVQSIDVVVATVDVIQHPVPRVEPPAARQPRAPPAF